MPEEIALLGVDRRRLGGRLTGTLAHVGQISLLGAELEQNGPLGGREILGEAQSPLELTLSFAVGAGAGGFFGRG